MKIGGSPAIEQWVCQQTGLRWLPQAGHSLGFFSNEGRLLGAVYFSGYDGVNVILAAAGMPGSRWLDRRGLWAIFHYTFEQLGCARATAFVPESNEKSIKLVKQAGMVYEAALERAAPGAERMLVFRMFADECPWLNRGKRDAEPHNSRNPNRSR